MNDGELALAVKSHALQRLDVAISLGNLGIQVCHHPKQVAVARGEFIDSPHGAELENDKMHMKTHLDSE